MKNATKIIIKSIMFIILAIFSYSVITYTSETVDFLFKVFGYILAFLLIMILAVNPINKLINILKRK